MDFLRHYSVLMSSGKNDRDSECVTGSFGLDLEVKGLFFWGHLNCPDEWLSREAEVSKNECLDKAYAKALKCKKHGIVRSL